MTSSLLKHNQKLVITVKQVVLPTHNKLSAIARSSYCILFLKPAKLNEKKSNCKAYFFFLKITNTYLLCAMWLHRAAPNLILWGSPVSHLGSSCSQCATIESRFTIELGCVCLYTHSAAWPHPHSYFLGFDWQQQEPESCEERKTDR